MAKNSFSALNQLSRQIPGTRKYASETTEKMLYGNSDRPVNEVPEMQTEAIRLDLIKEREENFFSEVPDDQLIESIRQYGVINPLAVTMKEGDKTYTISAGHRRFAAMKKLHEEDPENPLYTTIDCRVYVITDDPEKLKLRREYITKEQEEAIYEESNLLTRQLTERDGARNMRYICSKFSDKEYVQNIARQAEKRGEKISIDRVNTWKLAETVLASMNIQGWKKTKIKYYIAVYNAGRQDLLDQIENGTLSVKSAYETINEKRKNERNAGRKSNKIAPFRRASKEFFLEAEKREYSAAEVNELKKIYESLGKIIEKNQ